MATKKEAEKKRLLREIGNLCHECCERGFDWDGDVVCPRCQLSKLYDAMNIELEGE